MEEKIKENINNPGKLESLYREDKKSFEAGFEKVYSEIDNYELAKFWRIRLEFDRNPDKIKKSYQPDIFMMIAACIITGFLIKIPDIININLIDYLFYEKNAAIIAFSGLTIYTVWVNKIIGKKSLAITVIVFLIAVLYVNLLPSGRESDSVNLAYLHLPLLMWSTYGLVFINFDIKDKTRRIDYIRYNGDLAILLAIILIAGGILSLVTIGLFSAIGINIENFYMENVAIIGLVSAPIVATYILTNFPTMTNKIAPVISGIFSPLVLLTAIIYLIAIAISGKDPYNDRNFLLIFNIMLLGVMAIIVFSVSETSTTGKQRFNEMILLILSIITIIIDLVALSAIFYRLGTYGITPNRLAVLGSNILILLNLVLIMIDLYKTNFRKKAIGEVGLTIAGYMPVYVIWICFVIFGFPLIFGME